jgi:hypothetical protein
MGALGRFFRGASKTVTLDTPKQAWQKKIWEDAIKEAIEAKGMDPAKLKGLDGKSKQMVISGLTKEEADFIEKTIKESTLQVKNQEGKNSRGIIGAVVGLCQTTSTHKLTIDAKDPSAIAFLNSLQEQLVSGKLGADRFNIKVNEKTGNVSVEMKATGDGARAKLADGLSDLAAKAHYDLN